jgi:group I intron endonuclease
MSILIQELFSFNLDSMYDAQRICGIYAIKRDERAYIGHSSNITKRWSNHKSDLRRGVHDNPHLQNAWDKYGEEEFEFVVLEECEVELLHIREQHHLDQHLDNYNCGTIVASPMRGRKHTPGAKEKISAAKVGCKGSVGHVVSPEARKKISAAQIGNTNCVGRVLSPESKAKMSASHTGKRLSDETRSKMGEVRKGRKKSAETRARMAAAQKARRERERLNDCSSTVGDTTVP